MKAETEAHDGRPPASGVPAEDAPYRAAKDGPVSPGQARTRLNIDKIDFCYR